MKACTGQPEGFSMLEILIALVLFVIALLGTAPLLTSSILNDANSRTASAAAASAEAMVEQLKSTGYTNVANGSDSVTVDGVVYNRSWVVTDVTANALREVTVTVAWGSANNHIAISAYLARPS
ncbi:MAG: prepilin-type N-terminal cleavage/methylation domain-containing protein [Syntrophorhabdales bacterium]|jgi:prepilin-type N-terminal cleavage/methylation domain-containing protein